MARPRKGAPGAELATERWRETMQERYGNVTEKMQQTGSIGGRNSNNGGFASKKVGSDGLTGAERAARVGRKAGKISKRNHKFIKQEGGYNYYIAKDTGNMVKYKHESRS